MQNKTKKTAPTEQETTNTTATPCIFTPADRKRLKPLLSKDSFDQLMKVVAGDEMPLPLVDSDGEEIGFRSIEAISINHWDDDGEERIYQIGKKVYAYYDDRGDFFVYQEDHVARVIEWSYPQEDEYLEEKCVQFEIEPLLRLAKRGDNGLCRVWINTFYRYNRSDSDSSRWARGDDSKIIWFDSYSDARKWINQDMKEHHGYADIQYPKGFYLKSHNEYAPREYKICK